MANKKLTDKQILDMTIKGIKDMAKMFLADSFVEPGKIMLKHQADREKAYVLQGIGTTILVARGMDAVLAAKSMGIEVRDNHRKH